MYTLHKDKSTKGYTYPIIDCAAEIVCDAILLNYTLNENYWFISTNKEDGDVMSRLNHIILPNITMIKIVSKNNCRRGATESKENGWDL